ncbi:hypothetical protein HZF09_08370 [Ramlibacter sp. CGMCC 1.13660]|uniref:hypothetical protein n=1 Tax=Ramlibacter sp. CGMCC 1.13660 TaxID=2755558 RepID=UPI0012FC5E76|nr:hypothetical protein [Ramlibacter sp. CGMCC 1.13660]MBA2962134.1 hypothetical protein [Ramlibacter sp. CGMCC 1.13660]
MKKPDVQSGSLLERGRSPPDLPARPLALDMSEAEWERVVAERKALVAPHRDHPAVRRALEILVPDVLSEDAFVVWLANPTWFHGGLRSVDMLEGDPESVVAHAQWELENRLDPH